MEIKTFEEIYKLNEASAMSNAYKILSRSNAFRDWMSKQLKVKLPPERIKYLNEYWSCVGHQAARGKGVKSELNKQKDFILEHYGLTVEDIIKKLKEIN